MRRSESITEIAKALCQAQAKMDAAQKKSANDFLTTSYADLYQVVLAIKKPFAENGLSYLQTPVREGETAGVTTLLMHTSGEWVESTYTLPLAKFDSQAVGSCITYARRYALQAIAGIPAADDDGNSAAAAAPPGPDLVAHNAAMQRNMPSIVAIKAGIEAQFWESVAEAWEEVDRDDKEALWVAPSKGGVFTTAERAALKSNEVNAARKAMYGDSDNE